MKTYIVDWGEGANGGRYGILQSRDIHEAFWDADSIGSPFKLAEFKLPKDEDGVRYLEVSAPEEAYYGASFDCFKWIESGSIFSEVYSKMAKKEKNKNSI